MIAGGPVIKGGTTGDSKRNSWKVIVMRRRVVSRVINLWVSIIVKVPISRKSCHWLSLSRSIES